MAAKTKSKGRKKAAKKPAKAAPKARAAKPKAAKPAPAPEAPARERDARLPKPGELITRTFQGKDISVQVLDAGFLYAGQTWRSLSAIAKEVTGTSWNGFLFFGLQTRATGAKGGAA